MEHRIPEKSGVSFSISEGYQFTVTTPEGSQIADLVAFSQDKYDEKFSPAYSRHLNSKICLTEGDSLYSTEGNPMLTIIQDDCGYNDILYGPCNEWMLGQIFQPEPGGCRENLALAVEPLGLSENQVPDTLNIFQKTSVNGETYEIEPKSNPSVPGDSITFMTDMDAIVAVTSCSTEHPANGNEVTPIDLTIEEGDIIHQASVQ